ncbi:MAG: hypothetical protein JSR78_16165 [Proteobacteria bacterium]|nr:hypothetical protein [Pseudomonadota bacterium]
MEFDFQSDSQASAASRVTAAIWIALIAILSVGGSFAFACAAPLAAIAALAAARMDGRTGLGLVVAAWLTNQIVGYGFLGYPHTFESYTWGAAIGVATIAAFAMARLTRAFAHSWPAVLGVSFLVAFASYELALFAAGIALGSSEYAFSAAVVARVFQVNAVSFVGLVAVSAIWSYFARLPMLTRQTSRAA